MEDSCGKRQFRCEPSGICISAAWRCDGQNDCHDEEPQRGEPSSDEKNCHCGIGKFRCRNGLCINASWRCDGTNDCNDEDDDLWLPGSDEINCRTTNSNDVGSSERLSGFRTMSVVIGPVVCLILLIIIIAIYWRYKVKRRSAPKRDDENTTSPREQFPLMPSAPCIPSHSTGPAAFPPANQGPGIAVLGAGYDVTGYPGEQRHGETSIMVGPGAGLPAHPEPRYGESSGMVGPGAGLPAHPEPRYGETSGMVGPGAGLSPPDYSCARSMGGPQLPPPSYEEVMAVVEKHDIK